MLNVKVEDVENHIPDQDTGDRHADLQKTQIAEAQASGRIDIARK